MRRESVDAVVMRRLVMGGDGFLPFCCREPRPPHTTTEEYAYSVLLTAYSRGVRAFDFSWHGPLIAALRRLAEQKGDISCFANLNWRCGLTLDGCDLIDLRDRFIRTIYEKRLSAAERRYVDSLPASIRAHWFGFRAGTCGMSSGDVGRIAFDVTKYDSRLKQVSSIAEHCLIGTDVVDWLLVLERTDILQRMLDRVMASDMQPILITHWTSRVVPIAAEYPFAALWCMLNPRVVFYSRTAATRALENVSIPVYAFSILRGASRTSVEQRIDRALSYPSVTHLVVGLKTETEVIQTTAAFRRALERPGLHERGQGRLAG